MSDQPQLGVESYGVENWLSKATPGDPRVDVRVRTDLGHVNVRGEADNLSFLAAIETVTGVSLPLTPNTYQMGEGDLRALWLGPSEWLLMAPSHRIDGMVSELRTGLHDAFAAINDLSGGMVTLEVSGTESTDLLSKGCTLDFHPLSFTAGQCAQSGFAKANVLIAKLSNEPRYSISVRRTFADYVLTWMTARAGSDGLAITSV